MSRRPLAGVESGVWWVALLLLAVDRTVRRALRPFRRPPADTATTSSTEDPR